MYRWMDGCRVLNANLRLIVPVIVMQSHEAKPSMI